MPHPGLPALCIIPFSHFACFTFRSIGNASEPVSNVPCSGSTAALPLYVLLSLLPKQGHSTAYRSRTTQGKESSHARLWPTAGLARGSRLLVALKKKARGKVSVQHTSAQMVRRGRCRAGLTVDSPHHASTYIVKVKAHSLEPWAVHGAKSLKEKKDSVTIGWQ